MFEREPPLTQLQITWSISVGNEWLWGDISHKCVGLGCIPGCRFSVSQCAEVNKRQAPSPRQSEFKYKVKHGRLIPPTGGSTRYHAGLRAPALSADVSGEHCPAVVGRYGKPLTRLFETVTGDNAGRMTAGILDWRRVVKDVDGEDKKCVWCRGGEGRPRSS